MVAYTGADLRVLDEGRIIGRWRLWGSRVVSGLLGVQSLFPLTGVESLDGVMQEIADKHDEEVLGEDRDLDAEAADMAEQIAAEIGTPF